MAAYLYYERNLAQEEIARKLEVSRHRVGTVHIVREPGQRKPDLEAAPVQQFPLEAAIVISGALTVGQAHSTLLVRGDLGLLQENLAGVRHVDLGWDRSILAFAQAVEQGGAQAAGNHPVPMGYPSRH